MNKGRSVNRLDQGQQIKLYEWLKKRLPAFKEDRTPLEEAAAQASATLGFQVTGSNIKRFTGSHGKHRATMPHRWAPSEKKDSNLSSEHSENVVDDRLVALESALPFVVKLLDQTMSELGAAPSGPDDCHRWDVLRDRLLGADHVAQRRRRDAVHNEGLG